MECPLSKMLGTRCVSNVEVFLILEYLRRNDASWGWDPNLNTKFIHVFYTPYKYPGGDFIQHFHGNFLKRIFDLWLVESQDEESIGTED
jgi:hypothetical protein